MKNWEKFKVNKECAIIDALKTIEAAGSKFSIVVDSDGKLCGTLTDGDIRRGILKGVGLHEKVTVVMNAKPILASQLNGSETISLLKKSQINFFPHIDERGLLVGLLAMDELEQQLTTRENAVVLMAGGLGARLGELTSKCPKPMLKVGNKPILQIIIENFRKAGFRNIYLSVNYMSDVIETYFGHGEDFGVNINYLREKDRMGTAGSLSLLEPINDLPMIVMNGDLLTKVDFDSLVNFHTHSPYDAIMCVRQYDYQIPFGVVNIEGTTFSQVQEKPIRSYLVNAGIYTLDPRLVEKIPRTEYLDMPTFFTELKSNNKKIGVFPVHEYWLDIGRKDDFVKAETEYHRVFSQDIYEN